MSLILRLPFSLKYCFNPRQIHMGKNCLQNKSYFVLTELAFQDKLSILLSFLTVKMLMLKYCVPLISLPFLLFKCGHLWNMALTYGRISSVNNKLH